MSSRVDLREFLAAYLAEADEQLAIVDARLLAIEPQARARRPAPREVRDLYRALHTIKGLSAMVGVDPLVDLAHRMEAVVRAGDAAGGRLAPQAIDRLLEAARAIAAALRTLEAKGTPTVAASLLASLDDDAVRRGVEPPAADGDPLVRLEPAIAAKLASYERDELARAPQSGKRACRIDFAPSPERAAAGTTINTVRERVAELASIVKVVPVATTPSESAPGGLVFVLLVVTDAPDAALAAAAGVTVADVTVLAEPETVAGASLLSEPPRIDDGVDDLAHAPRRSLLRVDVARVDDAMDRLGAMIVTRSRLQLEIERLESIGADGRDLRRIAGELARQLRDLRASILKVRMVPVSDVLERLPMVVRALERAGGKRVHLAVLGGDAELDKAVAERIFPAILHLVRNAVDHGIETPEERRAAGKRAEGAIGVTCAPRSSTRVEIVITDDGRGVDRDAVSRHAGVPIGEGDAALLDALCAPGFSTSDAVTTTSGRGMGMDIVRRVVDELGGELALSNHPGQGATFTLRVPLTIAVLDAFVVECARDRFVVPVTVVDEILDVADLAPSPLPAREARVRTSIVHRRGEPLALVDLAEVLGLERGDVVGTRALVVRRGEGATAFLVDRVLGQKEALVRPLTDPLVVVNGINGATDLGDGRATLVLDLPALASWLRTTPSASLTAKDAPPALPARAP